ncbi:MAG: hypothetical protein CSB44_09680 [Gammaproteobacteria bacterium]|nr:MAG: hypothetical protein CSB44_09680 [Gammaproteobacteria bacterium]
MSYSLRGTHLLRQFTLFGLTTLLCLTVLRAGYGLWYFERIDASTTLADFFLDGLRFDLALIGGMLLLPVVLGTSLSMATATRRTARWFINGFLFCSLALVLCLELVTPWFLESAGVRPDLPRLTELGSPVVLNTAVEQFGIPFGVGALLVLMLLISFGLRLEVLRFLRYRVATWQAVAILVAGGLLCVLALWSRVDLREPPLQPADARISDNPLVNELVMNTAWKVLFAGFHESVNTPRTALRKLLPPSPEVEDGADSGTAKPEAAAADNADGATAGDKASDDAHDKASDGADGTEGGTGGGTMRLQTLEEIGVSTE